MPKPSEFEPSELIFVTGHVSDVEVSAVSAVIRGLLWEESDERRAAPVQHRSAWQQGQRAIRQPVHPGAGRWRGFAG
ncbi:acyl-CoA carboxylase subunit epsilon [Cryobacterium sp. TMS1-13-1]|uniref:acyl-CoA carboxylase subunit epsilon n=1 Tax=Cryobacterium sp. TMS1-13-1 TaxID=1259220 RepID=UPI00106B28F9|nr:acyl-CoA carboxylase subunit epsilon [Cryobacterium sp. TMS1-13-1]TFD19519.1 acyl-CoA carboxylase subunit epsilon [Cryobacterium sp. TMS1-13-1]